MSEQRTIEGTVAQFQAWLDGRNDGASGTLTDLFLRAQRGGGDLHDPTAELVRWLSRDLARDPEVDGDRYSEAIAILPRYLTFLRAHGLWRRSERAVEDCWNAIGPAARQPLGIASLGDDTDRTLAEQLSNPPEPTQLVVAGVGASFAALLQSTLNTLVQRGALTPAEVGELTGLAPDSVALEIWIHGLGEAVLVREDDAGALVPLTEVSEAGGCPPPSSALIDRVVRALVRAAIVRCVVADDAADQPTLPRALALVTALVGATGNEPSREADEPEAFVREVLDALATFGLLTRSAEAFRAPESFRYGIAMAVAEATGAVGTPDEAVRWEPVELGFWLAADTAVDLLLTFEHDPQIWRRLRVLGAQTLDELHRILQVGLGWRDVRPYLFATGEGTRRFAPRWLLGALRSDEDSRVTDSGPVRLGSMLRGGDDELVYLYGALPNPWRIRLRVERVMSGVKESYAWLDGAGDAPEEPTRISEALQVRLPEGASVPPELERAWAFMERQGWTMTTDDGTELTAPGPPEARPGLVFSSGLGLEDRWGSEHAALARVVPIGASPDDTRIALWFDDDGAARVVALTPDGGASLVGDGAVDLLRLAAIGYPEISPRVLGRPPEDGDAVAGVGQFRGWVRSRLGVDVPDMWGAFESDRFTAWLEAQA